MVQEDDTDTMVEIIESHGLVAGSTAALINALEDEGYVIFKPDELEASIEAATGMKVRVRTSSIRRDQEAKRC